VAAASAAAASVAAAGAAAAAAAAGHIKIISTPIKIQAYVFLALELCKFHVFCLN
jgi:hypothetical protein